jgi:hypothetical protein
MTTSLDEYPIFAPDFPLPDRHGTPWSIEDARQYFEWFMITKDSRIAILHSYLHLSPTETGKQRIIELERKLVHRYDPSWKSGSGMISRAYSLGADVGIVFADIIEHEAVDQILSWIINNPKDPRHISFRLPVLSGFRKHMVLDPVLIGTNTLLGVVRDRPSGLVQAYHYWTALLGQ